MANPYFQFKQFTIHQDRCAMKVTTDACLFGAWLSEEVGRQESGVGRRSTTYRSVLDIGTGTGLLSLMLAQKDPGLTMDAIEIDKEAAEQAIENADASPWGKQVTVINDDARTFAFGKKYDYIISNPPFYENELASPDGRKNTAHHSGGLALYELLAIIKKNLAHDGWFFLLLPFKRNEEIRKMIVEHELTVSGIVFVRQSIKHDYFRILIMGKTGKVDNAETTIDELSIVDENNEYTPAFKRLLEPYYLYL